MSCNFDIQVFNNPLPNSLKFPQGKSFTVAGLREALHKYFDSCYGNVDLKFGAIRMAPCFFVIDKEVGYGDGGTYTVEISEIDIKVSGGNLETGEYVDFKIDKPKHRIVLTPEIEDELLARWDRSAWGE